MQVAGPLVAAVTVRLVTGLRFDPGFGVALALTVLGGTILSPGSLFGSGSVTFGGGEIVVLLSNALWTLYSIKAQAWFRPREPAPPRLRGLAVGLGLDDCCQPRADRRSAGRARRSTSRIPGSGRSSSASPFWPAGSGSYCWNIGASRLGVAVASLWVNLVPFFAVLWSMVYGFIPNAYQITGGLVALSGVVYMQWRKLQIMQR